jgi:hypothetical protein
LTNFSHAWADPLRAAAISAWSSSIRLMKSPSIAAPQILASKTGYWF